MSQITLIYFKTGHHLLEFSGQALSLAMPSDAQIGTSSLAPATLQQKGPFPYHVPGTSACNGGT